MTKMKKAYNIMRSFLGMRGSWKWACRQMEKGRIVKPRDAVSTKYRLDHEAQRRIQWCFTHTPYQTSNSEWDNANIFISDLESNKWEVCELDFHKEQ